MAQGSTNHLSRATNYYTGPGAPANRRLVDPTTGLTDAKLGSVGIPYTNLANINLGTPSLATTTFIVNAQAVAGAGNVATLAHTALDVPRALRVTSSSAGDTTQTVLVTGLDLYDAVMSELFTLNGTASIAGKKAFKSVTTVFVSAALAGNLSVGNSSVLGLPVAVDVGGLIIGKFGTNTADAGTFVKADRTTPATTTTGDTRGTYAPAGTLDAATQVTVLVAPAIGHLAGVSVNEASQQSYGVTQV